MEVASTDYAKLKVHFNLHYLQGSRIAVLAFPRQVYSQKLHFQLGVGLEALAYCCLKRFMLLQIS